MLDLSLINVPYELILEDGTELHLKRPTQSLQEAVVSLQPLVANPEKNIMKVMDAAIEIFTRILNRNIEGVEFDVKQVKDEYDMTIAMMVVNDYFAYWNNEVKQKVNFR